MGEGGRARKGAVSIGSSGHGGGGGGRGGEGASESDRRVSARSNEAKAAGRHQCELVNTGLCEVACVNWSSDRRVSARGNEAKAAGRLQCELVNTGLCELVKRPAGQRTREQGGARSGRPVLTGQDWP